MEVIKNKLKETFLTEGTRYDKQATKIISDSGLFDEKTSEEKINELFRNKIHAFVHSPNWLEKYLKGIARMIVEESNGDRQKAETFIKECPEIFDKYLTWIKANREKEGAEKLDNAFVNTLHYQDIKDFLNKRQSELDAQSKDELSKMDFSKSSNYTLVPIESYKDFHNKYGGHWTGNGSSDKYAGDGGTAWCHANDKDIYKNWTSDGEKFFVLQNNNWKNIPFDENSNNQNPKDTYGTSLIAIRVDKYGKLRNATLRCNHTGVYSDADNQYETYAELSKVAGFNVEEKVKELLENIPDPLIIKDGILKECDDKDVINIKIPDSVTSIGEWAFSGCGSLTSIEIPSSVTSIGYGAFYECDSLTSVKIPNSVTYIGKSAFSGCDSLTSIEISDSVTWIGDAAFCGCTNLTNIKIGSGITSIEFGTFEGCSSLTSIKIPDGVTSIGLYAFSGCDSLTSIEIPYGVTRIGSMAFYLCSSLKSVKIPNSVISIGNNIFEDCNDKLIIYTDNKYVMNYCEKNFIKYETITKKENLTINEALQKLNNIKE